MTTRCYPNRAPIGAPYPVGGRTFGPRTPRCVLADALQDAGRAWEAELLRSPDPVVFGSCVRTPHVADVAGELHRLLPEIAARGWPLVAWPGGAHDAVELVFPVQYDAHRVGRGTQRHQWAAADTGRVYAALRRRKPGKLRDPWQVRRKLVATGAAVAFEQLDEAGTPTAFAVGGGICAPIIEIPWPQSG
jgi:hypothetical protein